MQDDEMDNMDELIREASKSYHPVYDDKAWERMEILLNKHLPQNDDRKRPAVFFLLLLFIAGVFYFLFLYPWNKNGHKPGNAIESKTAAISLQTIPANTLRVEAHLLAKGPKSINEIVSGIGTNNTRKNFTKTSRNKYLTTKGNYSSASSSGEINEFFDDKDMPPIINKELPPEKEHAGNEDKDGRPVSPKDHEMDLFVNTGKGVVKKDSAGISVAPLITKEEATAAISKPASNKLPVLKKVKKGFANNFALTLSAGPDFGFVNLGDPGKTRLNYGAGLSYTFINRLMLSTGFYVSTKTYAAKPADYHPPYGYWTYNTNLQRVDADCKVYEIPMSANYFFKQTKSHQWFAGLGLSTLLMKRETYNYLYKNTQGQTLYKGWTLRNKNRHYFSVLTITGGYQYRFSQLFSMMASPYLKLPLHGIGFGKINLNSGGLLVTAIIQPFAGRK